MISILDRYIAKTVLLTSALSLTILTGLSSLIRFVEQLRSVGRGNYEIADAGLFVLFSIPRDIEVFFPMSALLGGLIGMGMLASNSELVVMLAAGRSRLNIIGSVMKAAIVMMLAVMALGEFVTPQLEAEARELRARAISGGSLISAQQGIWAKDGSHFVNIGEVESTGRLRDITIYAFDGERNLERVIAGRNAVYQDQTWKMNQVEITTHGLERIERLQQDYYLWQSSLTPDKLGVVTVKPESLSLRGLTEYLDYLSANKQDAARYQLAFWRKLLAPVTVAVMLLVALSFIFGPLRSTTMGARILLGVMTGFGFHVSNEIFGPLAQVYQLPAFFGAVLPSLIFAVAAIWVLQKHR
ncbi:LPS export ABC transporter permease LptG [Pseudidiomarina taiwanensis]|uniref:Lipopolysaccharide ABC transporter permease LptG n=1 Tax=Pseudidiomarina taiwanensis TaxID=337250 RepID=A0A432ZM88_9GAMM|nr:LPS export ABC transporter permease LptG [Pseudidiomarina taiwanensis]RUO78995.1 lipopolysaccharide ABC transporter permease LptG [Pseudidiomarina taiwanensis]